MRQQADCRGTGHKVATRASRAGLRRRLQCTACGRVVPVNYDGTLRHHVAKLLR